MKMRIEPIARTTQRIGPMFPEDQSMLGDHAHQLDIGLEVQLRNNWCWAAVSCAIAAHYGDLSWSQESLAWRILAIDTVKANSAPPSKLLTDKKFDQQTSLEATLRYVNCLVGWSGGRPPFRRLMREIDQGRPMGVAIRWHAGTQHYVIIDGYDRTSRTISIADSQAGRDTVAYDQFPENYRTGGEWMETYWTGRPSQALKHQQGEIENE